MKKGKVKCACGGSEIINIADLFKNGKLAVEVVEPVKIIITQNGDYSKLPIGYVVLDPTLDRSVISKTNKWALQPSGIIRRDGNFELLCFDLVMDADLKIKEENR